MTDPRRHGAARSEFRYDSEIDEGHLEFRALARADKVAVRQHGGPPPMAAPWTAATSGLSRLTNAFMRPACGDSPGPGGFLRKSSISLPAQKESPAPCQSTTRVFWSFAALLKMPARATYMADVIAFRFVGRFNWTRRMPPVCSVTISSMVEVLVVLVNFTASRGSGWLPPPRTCRRARPHVPLLSEWRHSHASHRFRSR